MRRSDPTVWTLAMWHSLLENQPVFETVKQTKHMLERRKDALQYFLTLLSVSSNPAEINFIQRVDKITYQWYRLTTFLEN